MPGQYSHALAEHEAVIQRGLTTFVEVGTALLAIREGRLYRADHATFEDYCQERWNLTPQHAGRLMVAAEVAAQIEPIGSIAVSNERQARELAKVPAEQRAEVWQQTVERTNGRPTAATVRETYRPPEPNRPPISDEHVAELRGLEKHPVPVEPAKPQPSPAVTALASAALPNRRA